MGRLSVSACTKGYYRDASLNKCTTCPPHSTTATEASTTLQHCTCVEGSSGPQGGPCTGRTYIHNRHIIFLFLMVHFLGLAILNCYHFALVLVVECDPLPDPDNGTILSCSRIQDSECEAQCDAGYILSGGTRRRRCTAQGWTGAAAVCTGRACLCIKSAEKLVEEVNNKENSRFSAIPHFIKFCPFMMQNQT